MPKAIHPSPVHQCPCCHGTWTRDTTCLWCKNAECPGPRDGVAWCRRKDDFSRGVTRRGLAPTQDAF